ncbi:hypothetical protein PVAP13_3KG227970 [Panicum virgatum]|uniref:Uncharacterized protein n=1 Tax=Panicum virgatum TaxID=38727 RepID=A0A8T0V3N9_PANVG|nr:hypothetical protein PVAP13_3KG227970 [Panicum virgatum]
MSSTPRTPRPTSPSPATTPAPAPNHPNHTPPPRSSPCASPPFEEQVDYSFSPSPGHSTSGLGCVRGESSPTRHADSRRASYLEALLSPRRPHPRCSASVPGERLPPRSAAPTEAEPASTTGWFGLPPTSGGCWEPSCFSTAFIRPTTPPPPPPPPSTEFPALVTPSTTPAMEIIPGEPHRRPELMANLEEEYRHNAVIVVIIGDRDALSCSHVTGFLVLFKEEGLREQALALRPGVKIRGKAIRVMPWTHLSHASLSMLHFKVRLCIEGVPPHAHQLEAMAQLLPREMLLEKLDFQAKNTSEAACCCIWAWVKNPDDVAKSGTLQLEAVSERTEEVWHYNWGNGIAARCMRSARPVNMLSYNTLIHLDRVIDFWPTSPGDAWPKVHDFFWHFGVKDGARVAVRQSAHTRLGHRKRDRSPPGAGGRSSEDDTASSSRRGVGPYCFTMHGPAPIGRPYPRAATHPGGGRCGRPGRDATYPGGGHCGRPGRLARPTAPRQGRSDAAPRQGRPDATGGQPAVANFAAVDPTSDQAPPP